MKNKLAVFFIFLFVVTGTVNAKETYYKPSKNEVVLVFSCKITPEINREFFKQYAGKEGNYLKFKEAGNKAFREFFVGKEYNTDFMKLDTDTVTLALYKLYPGETGGIRDFDRQYSLFQHYTDESVGVLVDTHTEYSDLMSITVEIPKSRKFELNGFRYHICDSKLLAIDLPVLAEIQVPKGIKYLYLGDFEYTTSGPNLEVSDVKKNEALDEAEKIIQKRYSTTDNLVQALLRPMKEVSR